MKIFPSFACNPFQMMVGIWCHLNSKILNSILMLFFTRNRNPVPSSHLRKHNRQTKVSSSHCLLTLPILLYPIPARDQSPQGDLVGKLEIASIAIADRSSLTTQWRYWCGRCWTEESGLRKCKQQFRARFIQIARLCAQAFGRASNQEKYKRIASFREFLGELLNRYESANSDQEDVKRLRRRG